MADQVAPPITAIVRRTAPSSSSAALLASSILKTLVSVPLAATENTLMPSSTLPATNT